MYRQVHPSRRAIKAALLLLLGASLVSLFSITTPGSATLLATPTASLTRATADVLPAASDADAELQFQCPGALAVQSTDVVVADEPVVSAATASPAPAGMATDLTQQNRVFLPLALRSPDIRFQLISRNGVTEQTGRAGTTIVYPLRLVNEGSAIPALTLSFRSRCGSPGGIPGCIDSFDSTSFANIQSNEGRDFNLVVTLPANAPDNAAGLTEVVATASAALNVSVAQMISLRTTVTPAPTATPEPTSTPRNDTEGPDISIQISPSSAEVVTGGNRIYEVRVRNTGDRASTRIELEIPLDRDLVRLLDTSLPGNNNGDWVRDAGDSSGVIKIRFNNLRRNQERRYQLCFQTLRPGVYEERGSFTWAERDGDDRRTNRFRLEIRQQAAFLDGRPQTVARRDRRR